jgi:hypothetical protein
LQVRINHKVQSRAYKYLVELQRETEKQDMLEIFYEKDKSKTQEEREGLKGFEQKVVGTYEKIPQVPQRD